MKRLFKAVACVLCACMFALQAVGCNPSSEYKPFPSTDGDMYTSIGYDYVEHWVHVDADRNIYGNIYLPKDFDSAKTYPVIIMSHGLTASYSMYYPYIYTLTNYGFVCYAYDFCGGALDSRSDGDFYDMSVMTEVRDLKCVLADIKAQSYFESCDIYLMGESQGGLVTALAAPSVSGDISGIVLLYPAFNIPDDVRSRYSSKESIPDFPTFLGVTVGRIYGEDIYDLHQYDKCAEYKGKVWIYHGDSDGLVDISWSQKALDYYENAELITIVGGTHRFDGRFVADICEDFASKVQGA